MSKDIDKVKELYPVVFSPSGDVKLCGRDNCINLMEALSRIFDGVDFGDLNTGYMNTDIVKEYCNRIL